MMFFLHDEFLNGMNVSRPSNIGIRTINDKIPDRIHKQSISLPTRRHFDKKQILRRILVPKS